MLLLTGVAKANIGAYDNKMDCPLGIGILNLEQ